MAAPALLRCSQAVPGKAGAVLAKAHAHARIVQAMPKARIDSVARWSRLASCSAAAAGHTCPGHRKLLVGRGHEYGHPLGACFDARTSTPHRSLLVLAPLIPRPLLRRLSRVPGSSVSGVRGGDLSGVPGGYLRPRRRAPLVTLAAAPSSRSGRGFSSSSPPSSPSSSRVARGREGDNRTGEGPGSRGAKQRRAWEGPSEDEGWRVGKSGAQQGKARGAQSRDVGFPRRQRVNEDDAIAELLGYQHGSSSSRSSSGGGVPISEDETAAGAAALAAMIQRRRPGGAAQALGSLVKVLVEEQSKMPWDVEEERQEQQNAAETAYEAMRQRRKRQAAKNRRAAKQSRLEQAMASMSAEEVMLQSLLREQEEALGGRAPEEVLRHVPADLEMELFEEWAKEKLARAPPGEKGLLMVSGLSHMRKQLKRSGGTGVPAVYPGAAQSQQQAEGRRQLASGAQRLAPKARLMEPKGEVAVRPGRAQAARQGRGSRDGTGSEAKPRLERERLAPPQVVLGPNLASADAFDLPWSTPADSRDSLDARGSTGVDLGSTEPTWGGSPHAQGMWGLEGLRGGRGRGVSWAEAETDAEPLREQEVEVVGGTGGTRVTVAGAGGFTAQEWLSRGPQASLPSPMGIPGLGTSARSASALGAPAQRTSARGMPAWGVPARGRQALGTLPATPSTSGRGIFTSASNVGTSATSRGMSSSEKELTDVPTDEVTGARGTSSSTSLGERGRGGGPTSASGVRTSATAGGMSPSEKEPTNEPTDAPTGARGISSSASLGGRGRGGESEYRWQSRGPLKGVTWQGSSLYPGLPGRSRGGRRGALRPQEGGQWKNRGRGAQGVGAQGEGAAQGPGAEEAGGGSEGEEQGRTGAGGAVLNGSDLEGVPDLALPAPEVLTGPLARAAQRPQMVKARKGRGKGKGIGEGEAGREGNSLPAVLDGPAGTVILVDKPKTWTSFAVCARLRSLFKIKKVGHAGTLDPMATGLLVVCLGKATKFADSYQAMTKVYSGVMKLGEETPSLDADTEVSQVKEWHHVSNEMLTEAARSFLGDQLQVPPMYSAIKVKGEKMYDKARRGESLDLPPRPIKIYELRVWRQAGGLEPQSLGSAGVGTGVSVSTYGSGGVYAEAGEKGAVDAWGDEGTTSGEKREGTSEEEGKEDKGQYVCFHVTCSKGTYVRSLCRDLAAAVGTLGHLTALRREAIGSLSVEDAFSVEDITRMAKERESLLDVQVGDMVSSVRSRAR